MLDQFFDWLYRPFSVSFYVCIYINRIEITRLDTGEKLIKTAVNPFSHPRMIWGDLFAGERLVREALSQMMPKFPKIKFTDVFFVHPMEMKEGGLSKVEIRGLRDSFEHAGARQVEIVEEDETLSIAELQLRLSSMDKKRNNPFE